MRPECLIVSLFSEKDAKLSIDSLKFYSFFYKQKEEPEYQDLFTDIRFCGSPATPYSIALDDALFNLQFIGALTRENPELVTYTKTKKFDDVYQYLLKNIPEETKEKLKSLSEKYRSYTVDRPVYVDVF